ncbi:hypothetical protein DEQ92_20495 [Haloferax sp. Atlit-6N]|nr:hypothetical protein DEQ92_20495 [Haloferax sp. Atlit-6N]
MAVEPPPAEFTAYEPTRHVIQHAKGLSKGPNRHVDADLLRECIESGAARKVNRGMWRFEKEIAGVEFAVVVSSDSNEIITAFPTVVNRAEAEHIGYWADDELDDIEAAQEYHEQKPREY